MGQPLYRYAFGNAEFDEARGELRVGGLALELEQRPLQVLACLLHHADEVVPREELFDTVWAGRPTVDNVLANAVTKLRKALGAAGRDRIINLPRVGYRLCGPVERTVSGRRLRSRLDLLAGQPVPGREHFRLCEQLGPSRGNEVWLARHDKTGELRVYKFSADGERLAALKREATIHRLLHESLGDRDDFVRVIDWNFAVAPFYLECEYGGPDLARWAESESGLASLDQAQRLHLLLQIADAIAAAHGVGVLHKDIKPANVLMQPRGDGWQPRVADFGSGQLLHPERLQALGITAMGLTLTQVAGDASATPLYLAPELLARQAPTVQSDVYALGLMLYQLLVGDLHRLPAPGWEADIDDELLREDIAAATDGAPSRRLGSVGELCERLRTREARRTGRQQLRAAEARAQRAEQRLERSRARRPWVAAALLVLLVGLGTSLWQFQRARVARNEAQRQAAIATATNRFLNEDLLGAGIGGDSPAWYEKNPRLRDILDAAAGRLDQRYRKAPLLAAGLHQTLGRAYRSTGDYARSATQLKLAAELLRAHLDRGDERSLLAEYELAVMKAHLSQFKQATALLDRADAIAGVRRQSVSEIGLRSHLARGDLAYQQMQVQVARDNYETALTMQKILHADDAVMSAHLLLGIAGCELRMDHAAVAERLARQVLAGAPYTAQRVGLGVVALARSRLGDALRAQGHYAEAIAVTRQAAADYQAVQGASGQGTISTLSSLSYLYSLHGDTAKALDTQRDVYRRSLARWGSGNQYTLVEQLNLGSQEQEMGDLKTALVDLQSAESGLLALTGDSSPTVQAARVARANVLSDLGRNAEALALVEQVDPKAYQASTSDAGRGAVLKALRARILMRLGRREEGLAQLQQAVREMQADGVAAEEIAPYRASLHEGSVAAQ
ncbi:protein kinase domain-containing protein [Rhodanobacter spathiphylli]|uniref:protein kinase domain-containing protein n=1 Tax=Rhodanobacter spathiphylli TaxID=347483 RepID=UPI0002FCA611|nr:tetratricopeptide repeat protein [Rhodanobacter spathiphylli]